jgi:hypothetical protein
MLADSMNVTDFVRAKAQGPDHVNELSLRSAYEIAGGQPWSLTSPWRRDREDNSPRYKALLQRIRSAQLRAIRMRALWTDPAMGESGVEPWLFVLGISLRATETFGRRSGCPIFVHAGPETSGEVILVTEDGVRENLDGFDSARITSRISALGGRRVSFEWDNWGFITGLILKQRLGIGPPMWFEVK